MAFPKAIFALVITGCWTVFVLYWIVASVGIKRDISRGPWWTQWRLRVIVAAVLIGWSWRSLLQRHHFASGGFIFPVSTNTMVALAGSVICVLGIALALWARLHLGRNWSGAPALKEEHELITSGPYKHIRHPIYTGMMMASLGSALVNPAWVFLLVGICAMAIWRVKREELLMTQQFPNQYPEYKRRTWALIPYVY